MAQTVSITDKGSGRYEIKDSDGQTRVVDFATASSEAKKSGLKITVSGSSSIPSPTTRTSGANGYSYVFGQNYPTNGVQSVPAGNVIVNGKVTSTNDAITQAQGAKNLGVIRTNLIKYGQLTKAEAKDPDKLLAKWASIVIGAANDPDPNNRDPFKYAQSLQKQGFVSSASAASGYQGPLSYPTVTNPEDAKSSIVKKFKELLNREPTDAEVAAATKALNADETNPKNVRVQTPIKNAAGEITGYKTTGGTNTDQFLTDYLTSNFASEVSTIKTQAPDITQLLKDKKTYDDLIAKAAGDKAKIDAAKQNTTYGRTLSEYEAQITRTAKSAGATNDPSSVSAIAKSVLDKGLGINSDSATSYINSQLTFGKGKVKTGATGTTAVDMYTGAAGSNVDALNKVALANGLNLDQVFDPAALNGVLSAVQSGENIDTYAKIIRDAAKIAWNVSDNVAKLMDQGVSLSSIYQPYKNLYASTLELDPSSVSLNDLAKIGVIGKQPEGSQAPQNLYDFQSALRKDNRWQYTRQAHEEVSGAVQKVLQDFGFMG